jgi:hypothetical protein
METRNVFFHEVKIGDVITYNLIYPKKIKVESKTYIPGQCNLTINEMGFASYGSAKIITDERK